jgi:16S rRNA (guanine(966)-N(2))-methyltransferase RsmD
VKTALFDILADRVVDATFLDLFGGVGGVGIEALSRGAAHATFIEHDAGIVNILQENLRITSLADDAAVIRGDAFRFLQSAAAQRRSFDIVYVAPPQYQQLAAKAWRQLDEHPLTTPGGLVIIQIHPRERIDFTAPGDLLRLTDERKYGSTLLLFFEHAAPDSEDDAL